MALRLAVGPAGYDELLLPVVGVDAEPAVRTAARERILSFSPTGRVPALIDRELGVTVPRCPPARRERGPRVRQLMSVSVCLSVTPCLCFCLCLSSSSPAPPEPHCAHQVYESLAIVLHLADRFPAAGLLPTDPAARADCLSSCAEMHAGFHALLAHLPFNAAAASAARHGAAALARPDVAADVDRVCALWASLRARHAAPAHAGGPAAAASAAGPFLFGGFTAADCMFAPVALRLRLYCGPGLSGLPAAAAAYVAAVCAAPGVEEWVRRACAEGPELRVPAYDAVADDGPLAVAGAKSEGRAEKSAEAAEAAGEAEVAAAAAAALGAARVAAAAGPPPPPLMARLRAGRRQEAPQASGGGADLH